MGSRRNSSYVKQFTDNLGKIPAATDAAAKSVASLVTSADGAAGPLDAITKGISSLGSDLGKGTGDVSSSGGGIGSLIGLIGKAFGIGANAEGTDDWRGGLSMVGERGPELVNMPRGSQVIPNNLLRGMTAKASGGDAGITHAPTFNVDARGAQMGVGEQITAALQGYNAHLTCNLPAMVGAAQRRGF